MVLWNTKRSADSPVGQAPLPSPGDFVQLQAAREEGGALYGAQMRVLGLRRLYLDLTAPLNLPPRSAITVTFIHGDALYRFETRLVGPAHAGRLILARPRRVVRIQRRQYYRLPMESPTTYRLLLSDGRRDPSGPSPARLINMSGGGVLLACGKPVPAGLSVAVRIPAGTEGDLLDVEAEVLDCHVASQGASRVYLARLRFYDPPRLEAADRDAIIAFIFYQQRLMLRGRKLLRA
jgi:c-di-GMP-binding flagellar brake protein YcgR